MDNPFQEAKDLNLFQWLWKNKKKDMFGFTAVGLFFVIASIVRTEPGDIWGILAPIIFGTLAFVAGFVQPATIYWNNKKNYGAFENSFNKPEVKINSQLRTAEDQERVSKGTLYDTDSTLVRMSSNPTRDVYKRIILSGAAGSGKDYLKDRFNNLGFPVDVSYTTRPMRKGEIPGYTYNYISRLRFKLLKFFGRFYEAVEFNKAYYATGRKSWNNSVVFIMTPSGVSQISKKDRKDCIIVYLNIAEDIRRERISKRSDGGFDQVERRIKADNKDFEGFSLTADTIITDPMFDANQVVADLLAMASA